MPVSQGNINLYDLNADKALDDLDVQLAND